MTIELVGDLTAATLGKLLILCLDQWYNGWVDDITVLQRDIGLSDEEFVKALDYCQTAGLLQLTVLPFTND